MKPKVNPEQHNPTNKPRFNFTALYFLVFGVGIGIFAWQSLTPRTPGIPASGGMPSTNSSTSSVAGMNMGSNGTVMTLAKLDGDLHALLFTNDGRVMYGQHAGIQISSDGGQTWSTPSGQGDAMGLAVAQKNVMYLAGHDVFQKSVDGGKTWTSPGFGNLPGTDIHGFAVSEANDWLYANIAGKGLYRSTDGGQVWQAASAAMGGAMALAVGSGTPPALFAATMEGLISSSDGGASWAALPNASSLVGMALAVNPKTNTLYASSSTGVIRSNNAGETWTELGGPGEAVALIAIDPKNAAHLMTVSGSGQVYSSQDAGRTWTGR